MQGFYYNKYDTFNLSRLEIQCKNDAISTSTKSHSQAKMRIQMPIRTKMKNKSLI